MTQKVIAKGKLDWAEGVYLIWPEDVTYARFLHTLIHSSIGKVITVLVEELGEPLEEQLVSEISSIFS